MKTALVFLVLSLGIAAFVAVGAGLEAVTSGGEFRTAAAWWFCIVAPLVFIGLVLQKRESRREKAKNS